MDQGSSGELIRIFIDGVGGRAAGGRGGEGCGVWRRYHACVFVLFLLVFLLFVHDQLHKKADIVVAYYKTGVDIIILYL